MIIGVDILNVGFSSAVQHTSERRHSLRGIADIISLHIDIRFMASLAESERSCVAMNKHYVLGRDAHVLCAGLADKSSAEDVSLKECLSLFVACLETSPNRHAVGVSIQRVPALALAVLC